MKIRPYSPTKRESDTDFHSLARALAALDDPKKVAAFLRDLCTPAELESMCDRWKVVPQIASGEPYRAIHDKTGVSVTTIGRVARTLEQGAGGYAAALATQTPSP
ncbi:DNA-binding transcriptional regulator [Lysobacter sp. HDW10]|jgi:TrpR-related protein YerC/YecD|uniref:YerC/YecD family TrpR-related protein n=1 Tax=Lysobacter sp. HDW10 TaxID=2714936 RepID=UPI00140D452C|nr:YerC/YecD family TrpR-related protein [Lysobacter sp. HDW10]QIK81850.1 DNA-binding transcriptional regulator [Lysobacter sp. HDW10]